MTTSATGGYLTPLSPVITEEQINDVWQGVVCGVTGLPGNRVRPRWQETPPKSPPKEADWCAIGVNEYSRDGHSEVIHSASGEGMDIVRTHDRLEILASFYGPHASDVARLFRDGLNISQNRDELRRAGFALTWVGDLIPAPELVNGLWRKRTDVHITAILETDRAYAVLNCDGGCLTFIETDIVPGGRESGTIPLGVTVCGRRE